MTVVRGIVQRRRASIERWLPVALAIGLAALVLGDVYTSVIVIVVVFGIAGAAVVPLTWSVPLLVFFLPIRFYVIYPGTELDVALTNFAVVGLGGACLANAMMKARPRLVAWERIILAWAVWVMVSLAWSTSRVASLRGVFQWMMVFSAILATAQCVLGASQPARAVRRLLGAMLALVGAWCIIGFIQVALGLDTLVGFLSSPAASVLYSPGLLATKLAAMNFNWRSGTDVRPFGPFPNAIEFGIFTAVGIGAAVAMALGRVRLAPRWLVITVLILAIAANVACLKATGWMAAGAAVAVAFVTLGRSIPRVLGVSALTLAVVGLLLFSLREQLADRVQELAVREGAGGATTEAISRPAVWLDYLDAATERPLVGLGVATAHEHGPVHWTRVPGTGTAVAEQVPTENSYLSALIETGAIGLVLLLLTVVGALVRGVKLSRRYPGDAVAQGAGVAAIGLAALLAGNMTVDGFNGEILGVIMGVLIGIVVAAVRLVPLTGRSSDAAGA